VTRCLTIRPDTRREIICVRPTQQLGGGAAALAGQRSDHPAPGGYLSAWQTPLGPEAPHHSLRTFVSAGRSVVSPTHGSGNSFGIAKDSRVAQASIRQCLLTAWTGRGHGYFRRKGRMRCGSSRRRFTIAINRATDRAAELGSAAASQWMRR
jgi:hypothetical protein